MLGEMDIDRFPSFPLNLGAESHRGRNKEEKLGSRRIDQLCKIQLCPVMYPRGKVLLYISREDTKERNNNQGRNEENRRRVDQSPRLMTYRAETEEDSMEAEVAKFYSRLLVRSRGNGESEKERIANSTLSKYLHALIYTYMCIYNDERFVHGHL